MKSIKSICVAAHDAGGAQILAALIAKYAGRYRWTVCGQGPADGIFKNPSIARHVKMVRRGRNSVETILKSAAPDLVLTGTGWSSDVEMDFIQTARKLGIRSVSFLDHWCNYRERFGYPGAWKENLPDHVFVGDIWAYRQAVADGFPKSRLCRVENPYWEQMRSRVKIRLLYLSSPIAEHALKAFGRENHWGFTEYDQVQDMLDLARIHPELSVSVRLHPSEKKNKYARFKGLAVHTAKTDLVEDCQSADIVVGCDTAALVAALIAGRAAISYVPAGTLKSTLPQPGITHVVSKGMLNKTIQTFFRPVGADFFTETLPEALLDLK